MANITAIAMNIKGAKKRRCEDTFVSLGAKIAFDKNRPAVSGVWALTAKLSGVSWKGKISEKIRNIFSLTNGKTHVAPKNYPLGGQ